VTQIMSGIAAASAEQMTGIGQVNRAIDGMNGATQQNAAMVEQAAANARSLQEQAGHLEHVVRTFKLRAQGQALQLPPPDAA
jgi:methyl-accepting chemotaxis protein